MNCFFKANSQLKTFIHHWNHDNWELKNIVNSTVYKLRFHFNIFYRNFVTWVLNLEQENTFYICIGEGPGNLTLMIRLCKPRFWQIFWTSDGIPCVTWIHEGTSAWFLSFGKKYLALGLISDKTSDPWVGLSSLIWIHILLGLNFLNLFRLVRGWKKQQFSVQRSSTHS